MSGREVWVRIVEGRPVIGVFESCSEGYRVSWDAQPAVVVPRQPPSVTVLREGSLEFQSVVAPDQLSERFRADPIGVVRDVLREDGKRMDERDIHDRLTKKLGIAGKIVSVGLSKALVAIRADPHVCFSPEYEWPCFEWLDEPGAADENALIKRRPWRYLANELTTLKLTEADRQVLQQRVAEDRPEPFLQRLGLAAVAAMDWPDETEVSARLARAGLGAELATLPDSLLAAIRARARASGRADVLWMLVLSARASKALRGIGAELGDNAESAVPVLDVLRAELRSLSRGAGPPWWLDVVERLPHLSDPRLVARLLAAAQVTADVSVRRRLAELIDPSVLLALPATEFAAAVEDLDAARAKAFCEESGLNDLRARFGELAPGTEGDEVSVMHTKHLPPREAAHLPLAQEAAASSPLAERSAARAPTVDPERTPLPAPAPDVKALLRRVTDRSGLATALGAAVEPTALTGTDVARVLRRLAETDAAFADAMTILRDTARWEDLEAQLAQAKALLAARDDELALLRDRVQAARDREIALTDSLKSQRERADRLAQTLREQHLEGLAVSDAERRQWRIDSLRAAVDLLNALDRADRISSEPPEFTAILARHGLVRVGDVGQLLPFDPNEHELSGDAPGELVKVVQPGYSFRDGETTTVLKRAVVASRRE